LCDGKVGLDAYRPDRLKDESLWALADRIGHRIEDSWKTPEATRGILSLYLRDGRAFTKSIAAPLGHPDHPMSDASLTAKFIENTGYARVPLPPEQAERIALRIAQLESLANLANVLA
jgi:2-methylcitrate dehydratase